jgi:hypothetical protein
VRGGLFVVLIATPYLLSCKSVESTTQAISSNRASQKITFNLSKISQDGLIGKAGGQRSLSYEFCIPANEATLSEVRAIDRSIQISRSPGRIGCTKSQYLVIGSTHQPGWREVLMAIAGLPYVQRIDEFVGE